MDKLEIDDKLAIVNRSVEYRISKRLLRKIPYFKKMLNHECLESKENKIVLDFDQRAIEAIFDWIKTGKGFFKMDYVIELCNIFDYFGLPDSYIAKCVDYFHDEFTIAHLPNVIPQVTSTSKLINSASLNAFICRYFTKIANTNVWLNYPLETIEYICKLDLMVHSELQVFEAIMKWANFKCDSRKCHLERLLKLVRWCHVKDEDLSKIMENEFVKSLKFNPKFCADGNGNYDCNLNRNEQEYFVMIEEYWHRSNDIRITVLANDLQPLFNRILELDETLPEHIIHDEHISDLHYVERDSDKEIMRIDWKNNKYRWLRFSAYSNKLIEYISIDSTDNCDRESSMKKVAFNQNHMYRRVLLEAKDKFILIKKYRHSCYYWSKPTADEVKGVPIFSNSSDKETVLDNKIYMLTSDLQFMELDIDDTDDIETNCKYKMFQLPKSKKNRYLKILHLASKQTNDDRVIFLDGSEKSVYCFNVNSQRWSSIGQIINCNFFGNRNKTKVISLTSAFISVDIINFA